MTLLRADKHHLVLALYLDRLLVVVPVVHIVFPVAECEVTSVQTYASLSARGANQNCRICSDTLSASCELFLVAAVLKDAAALGACKKFVAV